MSHNISTNISKITHTIMHPSTLMDKNILFITLLFIFLSPKSLDTKVNIYNDIMKHTIMFAISLVLLGFSKARIVKTCVLFFVLIPGFLIEIPPSKRHVFYTNTNSLQSILFHSLIFAILYTSIV